jgi:hypothetical protein
MAMVPLALHRLAGFPHRRVRLAAGTRQARASDGHSTGFV